MKRTIVIGSLVVVALLGVWAAGAAEKVDGKIRIESVATGRRSIQIKAIAENTGTVKHKFPVGCSLQRKNGSWYDIPYQIHKLEKGERRIVVFRADDINVRVFALVRVAIWHRERPDGLLETRYDMDERLIE